MPSCYARFTMRLFGSHSGLTHTHTHTHTHTSMSRRESDLQMGSCPLKRCLESGCYWKPYLCTSEPSVMDTRHHIRGCCHANSTTLFPLIWAIQDGYLWQWAVINPQSLKHLFTQISRGSSSALITGVYTTGLTEETITYPVLHYPLAFRPF